MKELVEVIAKALVDDPESVVVNEREEKKTTVLEVRVAESDMGKVIGKQGRIAKAIRSVVKAAAAKEDKKVIVDMGIPILSRDRPACGLSRLSYTAESYVQKKPLERRKRRK